MAYPAGVQTVTLRLGSSFDSAGTLASISGEVVPLFGLGADHLVWPDTGQTYAKVSTSLAWDDTEKVAYATVPHPTQAGWRDQTQATFTGWSYRITAVAVYAGGERHAFERTVTPLPGDTVIDVDLLPNGAAGTPTVTAEWEVARADALAALAATEVEQVTLTGDLAYTLPSTVGPNRTHSVVFTQDATGGHAVTFGGQPVTVDTTAGAVTTVELHPAGAGYVVRYPAKAALDTAAPTEGVTWDVDVETAVAPIAPDAPVLITTYAGAPNSIVHPSVLFFDGGWNGWRYWMVYTPFNGGDIAVENPSIAVSNDGDTWTTPAGLTNPIVARPGTGYNADPNLFMSPDGTMNMVWKSVTPTNTKETRLTTTRDGVTWTPSVLLFVNSFEDVSPAVLYDNGQYRMWTVKHSDTPNTMYVRTAPSPTGPWSAPVACTAALPAGAELWHMDIKRMGQQYHCLMQSMWAAPPYGEQLWFGKSNDGLTWTFASEPVMRAGINPHHTFYKPAILPKVTPKGLTYDLWYSTVSGFKLHKTRLAFDKAERLQDERTGVLSAINGLQPYIFADTFNRADTAAGLGTSTSGHLWTKVMGNDMGIVGGQAYLPVAGNTRWIVELGAADVEVGVTLKTLGASGWLMFRYVDATNLWRVGHTSGGTLQLQKIVAGALSATLVNNQVKVVNADRLTVSAKGSVIEVRVNGLVAYQLTDSSLSTGTKVGFNIDNIDARFDNLTARTI